MTAVATLTEPLTTRIYSGATLEDRRADQRRRLLDAARDAFAEKGYAATSIDDIVARARTSRTAFYRLFRNRQDCLLELYRDATGALAINLVKAAEAGGTPTTQVRRGVGALVETLAADPARARVMLVEVVGATPEVEAARTEARSRFAAIIARELASVPGWTDRPNAERELVAHATMGGIAEVLGQLATAGQLAKAEAVGDQLADYALRALTPPA